LEPTNTQLPATIQQAQVTADQRAVQLVPALVADLGDEAAWRYVEFFTANIRNPNTRRAYLRACSRFLGWCEDRGLTLAAIRPRDVATYIEELHAVVQAPSVKQQLAAIRMLFNWLVGIVTVTGGVQRGGEVKPRFMRRQPHLATGRLLRL